MYRIGEFSYLAQTTLKTLRYYDKINLLKPSYVDKYSNYRYYTDKELEVLNKIKKYQSVGFSLKEIKKLLENPNNKELNNKLREINMEKEEKEKTINKLMEKEENQKAEFIKIKPFHYVGMPVVIKNRKDKEEVFKVIKKIDKKVGLFSFYCSDIVVINYEQGYKTEDIFCFIGRKIKDEQVDLYELTVLKKHKDLHIFTTNRPGPKYLIHKKVNTTVEDAYKEIIEYANKNNYQIRMPFMEVYKLPNKDIDIYIDAYDRSVPNHHEEIFTKEKLKNLKDIHEKKYIGTWKVFGEVVEYPKFYKKKKERQIPNTTLSKITLNKDGTTNYDYITWKEDYLIKKYDNRIRLDDIRKKGKYLEIFVTGENDIVPYEYLYKKVK